MSRCILSGVLIAAAISLLGCSTNKSSAPRGVKSIPGVSNAALHILADNSRELPRSGTFGWGMCYFHLDPSLKIDLSLLDQRMHTALKSELGKKRFVLTETEPDLLVGYAIAGGDINAKKLNEAYGADFVMPQQEEGSASLKYHRGVLIVDIVERKTKRLLWRGAVTAGVDLQVSEKQKVERINAAIKVLLKHFPKV